MTRNDDPAGRGLVNDVQRHTAANEPARRAVQLCLITANAAHQEDVAVAASLGQRMSLLP